MALALFHGAPGFEVAKYLGLVPPMSVVEDMGHIYVEGINAIVWGAIYGALGWVIDRIRAAGHRVADA